MYYYFYFTSRRRHTRLQGDWSSDVCSSDLQQHHRHRFFLGLEREGDLGSWLWRGRLELVALAGRSEERRVGKECRARVWLYHGYKIVRNISNTVILYN